MSQPETIKEFLVNIGYKVDGNSQKVFKESLSRATKQVTLLAAAMQAATTAVVAGVTRMSRSMEDLYYASQRTGSTVSSINALTYAASQMGATASEARESLEGLAQRIRTNPGFGALVRGLVGAGVDINNTTKVIDALGARFRSMPYYMANAYAQTLGISESTMRAMMAGMGRFQDDYRRRLHRFGADADAAARIGTSFMQTFRETQSNLEVLGTRLLVAIGPRIERGFREFNKFLETNAKEINEVLEATANAFIRVSEIVIDAAVKIGKGLVALYEWFRDADPNTRSFVVAIAAVTGGLLLLTGALKASPIGLLVRLSAALGLLVADYLAWKNGGDSLIDWSKWEPGITAALDAMKTIRDWFVDANGDINGLQVAFATLLAYVAGRWALGMLAAFTSVSAGLARTVLGRLLLATPALAAAGVALTPSSTQPPGARETIDRMAADGSLQRDMDTAVEQQEQREHQRRVEAGQDSLKDSLLGFLRQLFGFEPAAASTTPTGPITPGSATPPPAAPTTPEGAPLVQGSPAHQERSRRLIADLQRDFGLTAAQAAGMVGNLDHESGLAGINERNPLIPGSRGGFGFAQWTGPRRVAFESFAAERGLDPTSYEANYGFLQHELANTSHGRQAVTAMLRTNNPGDSARAAFPFFSGGDPRTVPAMNSRWLRSSRALTNFQNAPPALAGAADTRLGDAGGAGVTINQTTTITVQGSSNPAATGEAVRGEQSRVNADLERNFRGAVR